MLKFYVKGFRASLFPNPAMYFIHVLYDDRYWSKILQCTIPLSCTWPKVKLIDFLCEFFTLKMRQKGKAQFRQAVLSGNKPYLFHYMILLKFV